MHLPVAPHPLRGDLVLVRFRGGIAPASAAIKRVVHDLDPEILAVPSTLRADMNDIAEQVWTVGEMLLFVAFVAAVLAIVGIYRIVGYSVTRRTREYGIRAALGVSARELMRMVFTSGIQPVLAGTTLGVVFAAMFSVAMVASHRNAPIPLSITNPIPYVIVCATLIASALIAMLRHAHRAAAIELRYGKNELDIRELIAVLGSVISSCERDFWRRDFAQSAKRD